MLKAKGAIPLLVAPVKGEVQSEEGTSEVAPLSFLICKSVVFDAVVVLGGKNSIQKLGTIGDALCFVLEAFKHFKPIVAIDEGVDFLQGLHLPGINVAKPGEGVVSEQGVVTTRKFAAPSGTTKEGEDSFSQAVFNAIAAHRHYQRNIDKVAA